MKLTIEKHWLTGAKKVISPNQDDRPDETEISLIVIHCISLPPGEFEGGYIDRLFSNSLLSDLHPYFSEISHLKVSAHILISRNGEITQYVPFNKRAWHAGISNYHGREKCNDFSIGIELEGTEEIPYTEAQYVKLALLIRTLFEYYPQLSLDRITGHSEIAPGRKTDPGASFDWSKLNRMLQKDS